MPKRVLETMNKYSFSYIKVSISICQTLSPHFGLEYLIKHVEMQQNPLYRMKNHCQLINFKICTSICSVTFIVSVVYLKGLLHLVAQAFQGIFGIEMMVV